MGETFHRIITIISGKMFVRLETPRKSFHVVYNWLLFFFPPVTLHIYSFCNLE